MRNVYVVTHPEATHHVEGRVGGWFDSELTSPGLAAAERVAASLAGRITAPAEVRLYTSDLRRTQQTAARVADRLAVRAVPLPELREKSYGEAEGRPQSWLDERFVPPPADGERLDHDEGVPGPETRAGWVRRVYRAMDGILEGAGQDVVVVTHGGSATFVVAHWIGMPLESLGRVRFRLTPGSITHLQEDDYFHNRSVQSLNEVAHLTGGAG